MRIFQLAKAFFAADQQPYREMIANKEVRDSANNSKLFGAKAHYNRDGSVDIVDNDARTVHVLDKRGRVIFSVTPKGIAM